MEHNNSIVSEEPLVYVLILNWHQVLDILKCLRSLKTDMYKNKKVVIIDNNTLSNEEECKLDGLTVLRNNNNTGYAGGNKIGVDFAMENKADLIWILNPDCVVKENSLKELVEAYKVYKMAIFGSLVFTNTGAVNFGGSRLVGSKLFKKLIFNSRIKEYGPRGYAKSTEIVPVVSGMSILIPLSVVKKNGFMDESYFLYAEEHDYCMRLEKKGIKSIIVPKSVVYHQRHGATKQNKKLKVILKFYKSRNRIVFAKRHLGIFVYIVNAFWLFVFSLHDIINNKGNEKYVNIDALFCGLKERMGIQEKYNPDVIYKEVGCGN